MNTTELVAKLSETHGLSKAQAKSIVDDFLKEPVAKLFGTPFHNPSQNRGNIFRIHPTIFKEIF